MRRVVHIWLYRTRKDKDHRGTPTRGTHFPADSRQGTPASGRNPVAHDRDHLDRGTVAKPPLFPKNLVALEIARDSNSAEKIVKGWQGQGLTRSVLIGIWIDLLFLLAYSNLLVCCCAWYAQLFSGWFARTGVFIAFLQWAAALCDMIENFYLFQMVLNTNGNGAEHCSLVSLLKWALILVGVTYILVAMALRARSLLGKKDVYAGWITIAGAVVLFVVLVTLTCQLRSAWREAGNGKTEKRSTFLHLVFGPFWHRDSNATARKDRAAFVLEKTSSWLNRKHVILHD